MIAIQQKKADGIFTNIHSMNIKKEEINYPIQIDKQFLCKRLNLDETRELRRSGIFSDLWLKAIGIPLEIYRKRKKFTVDESERIIAYLQARKFIP